MANNMVKFYKFLGSENKYIYTMYINNTLRLKKKKRQHVKLFSNSLAGKQYCKVYNISKSTLNKKRELGLIAYFLFGGNFYYIILEGGRENA